MPFFFIFLLLMIRAHSTHISFFIQLAYVFSGYFALYFSFIYFSFVFFLTGFMLILSLSLRGELSLKCLQLWLSLVAQTSSLVGTSHFILLLCSSTCSLNSDVQKPLVSLRETSSICSLYPRLTCHCPRLGDWIIVKWNDLTS